MTVNREKRFFWKKTENLWVGIAQLVVAGRFIRRLTLIPQIICSLISANLRSLRTI
jgi:hypothetical protein